MNEELRKIILRSKFKNKANKTRATADIADNKKQCNYVVCLNTESKHNYVNSLDTKNRAKPSRNDWKPYFPNKLSRGDTSIMLVEQDELILNETKLPLLSVPFSAR